MNIKVFSILNIPMDEIPKAKSPGPIVHMDPESSMFDLTGGDRLDNKIKESSEKRSNRFETPS